MASTSKLQPPPSANHVLTGPPKGVSGSNRKKQKRRAKQAAKASAHPHSLQPGTSHHNDVDYDEDPLGYRDEEEYDYSDADYNDKFLPPHPATNGYSMPPPPTVVSSNKKKKGNAHHHHSVYNPELLGNNVPPLPHPPPLPAGAKHTHMVGSKSIWNTSSAQERQDIKDFWLSLSEEERKSLLKIEKEAVLRKMKQQQKHSCSCTVCGRKRTAIEEELEVLYEGYYEELEQYAHHDHPPLTSEGLIPDPLQHRPHPLAVPPPQPQPHHRTSQLQEHFDDEEYSDEDEEDEEEYSDDYTDDERELAPPRRSAVEELFGFGESLTVKDNLLTVADDLLKNDGRKFIEMMEQLAERRMQRENQAEYEALNPSHPGAYPPDDPGYNHEDPLAAGDEYDDDEASYDSQEEYDDDDLEEDEMGGLTEEQRVKEGKRMFQIFAARMFEQRVLTAYKEKVAHERQQKLLEELEDETKLEAQREAKKQRDAEKKKAKKKQQQAAKAEEKAKKEAEKAAEEARLREAEEKKAEEQRQRKEEQRRKKEEAKRKQAEETARKEAEKARRQQEEQQKREEAERRAREQRAAEKAKKDEARKREREEREAREKAARELKAQEEKEKKEREAKAKAEREAKEREKAAQQAAQPPQPPQINKRPSQAGFVAVPPTLQKQASSGISSPRPTVATPAVPKAPTPARQRQPSQQGSHASSPKQAQSQISSAPSKSSSPGSVAPNQAQQPPIGPPKTIMQKPGNQQPGPQTSQPLHIMSPHQHVPMPPPGMPHPHHNAQGGFYPHMGFGQFPGPQGPMLHGNIGQRGPMPMYPQHGGPPMGMPNNRFGLAGMNGLPQSPPGMLPMQNRPMGFPFEAAGPGQIPPGFGLQHPMQQPSHTPVGQPPVSAAPGSDVPRPPIHSHSRQTSASDKERFESAVNQPIARPAPIQRPSSVKPQSLEHKSSNSDIEDLSKHLGSSALLDDSDEPIPNNLIENRRSSALPNANRAGQSFGHIGGGWNTPGLGGPFNQTPMMGASWPNSNNTSFGHNSSLPFNPLPTRTTGSVNRPLTIRQAVCNACRSLTATPQREGDGYHHVDALLEQIKSHRPVLDPLPTYDEIEEICETEGDSLNGGGELSVRRDGAGNAFSVKWVPDAATPDAGRGGLGGLGEIGSPMPGKSSPNTGVFASAPGAGRGSFQSLGALGPPGSGF